MENIQEIRLHILEKNFRRRSNVNKAYSDIRKMTDAGEKDKLRHLLRNHWEEPISTDAEVIFRDNVDFLIGYYSILAAGIVAGYLPPLLNEKNYREANTILTIPAVRDYYEKHYRLYLPQVLLKLLNQRPAAGSYFSAGEDERVANIFENFLLMIRGRMDDDDIDQFLWLLDDGSSYDGINYEVVNLNSFWAAFKNGETLTATYRKAVYEKSPLGFALNGFIKFISYLDNYEDLLESCGDNKLLQSSLWHMESYWFDHLRNKLGDVLQSGVKDIAEIVNSGYFAQMDSDIELISEDIDEWRNESKKQLEKSLYDIKFLFNSELGQPLISLLRN